MRASRYKALPHHRHFLTRLAKNALLALLLLIISLTIGIIGYHHYLGLGFYDSLINASMILTGMGPVDKAETDAAKVFTSLYAIYSGVAFLTGAGFLFIPILHRMLHKFHIEIEER